MLWEKNTVLAEKKKPNKPAFKVSRIGGAFLSNFGSQVLDVPH